MFNHSAYTFLILLFVSGWAVGIFPGPLSAPPSPGAEVPADLVYCLDVTKPSRNWDTAGARGAGVWFADALAPPGARRSVLVFSFQSRDLASHEQTPLYRRPAEPNPERSLDYALDQPAAGTPANPIWPLRRALDILDQGQGETQAIFLLLGHRVQIGPPDQLTPRIGDLAGEIVGRCRLQGVRLFVVHREDQPEMDRLWAELAGATGGGARFARTHTDMVRAAMEWSAALSGLQVVTLGADRLLAPPSPDRRYGVLFLGEGETLDTVQTALRSAQFSITRPEDLLFRGRFGLARVSPQGATPRLPFVPERILLVVGGLDRPVSAIVAPPLIADVSTQSPILARMFLEADGPHGAPPTLPPASVGTLRPLERTDGQTLTVPLVLGADPVTRATACQATFDTPVAPGPYRLSIGGDPRQGPSEFYQSHLHVFPDMLAVRPMLHRAGADASALMLRVTLPGGPYGDTRVFVSIQKNGGPVTFMEAPGGGLVSESVIATDYAIGDRYLFAAGALAFEADGGPRFIPGPLSEFPPRSYLFPDPLAAQRRVAEAPVDQPEATPHQERPPLPTELALALARAEATETPAMPDLIPLTPDAEADPGPFALSPAARNRLFFFLGNLAFFAVMTALYGLARRMGLFLGRGEEALSVPQYADTITIHDGSDDGEDDLDEDGLDDLMEQGAASDGRGAEEDLEALQREMEELEALEGEGDEDEEELFTQTTPVVAEEETSEAEVSTPEDAPEEALDEALSSGQAPATEDVSYTEEDLGKSLQDEPFAAEDQVRPQVRDMKNQRNAPTEAEERADDTAAEPQEEGSDEGFLSQADLDALLSGGAFSGGDEYERDEDGDLKF